MPRASITSTTGLTVFYGYPDHLVAEWCGVSVATARAYKAGKRAPSPQVLRLFELHAAGRVLGEEWDGWGVRGAALCNPFGNELTQDQLRAYSFVWQLAREYARENPRADETLQRLSAVKRVRVGAADLEAMRGPDALSVPEEFRALRAARESTGKRATGKRSA